MERRVTALPSVLPPSSRVDVAFTSDDAAVPAPTQTFGSTDEGGRAPRNRSSRHINFSDDGKLFEGHFTVQSRNLKSIIQYLVDRNAEQDVIVQDLQKQVHLLRTRQLKASQRSGRNGMELLAAAADSGAGGAGSDVDGRLRLVEQFLQLWGVRLSEVAELVGEHGDSVITPDAYTSYLLDLPAFRFTRREARAFMTSASQQPALNAAAAAASDTATRRRNNSNPSRRERGSASPPPDLERRKPEAEAPAAAATAAAASAESTVEKANAALAKAEALLAELRGIPARPAAAPPQLKGRSGAADRDKARTTSGSGGGSAGSGGGASGGSAVDAEARADIEELGEYVMRRFQELESQSMLTAAAAARATAVASASAPRSEKRGSVDRGAGGGTAQAKAAAAAARVAKPSPPKKGAANSPTSTQVAQLAAPPPPLPRAVPGEMIDLVAREDAAASLDLLEELESTVERRFKEVNSALASIAVRTAALAKAQVRSGSGSAEGERGQQGQQSPQRIPGSPKTSRGASTGSGGNKSRNATPGRRGDRGFDSPRQSLTAPVGDEWADAEHTESRPSSSAGAVLAAAAAAAAPAPARASASSSAAAAAKGSRPGKGKGGAAGALGDGVAAALVPAVDQVAREETAVLSDRVSDLEEELLERWQAMEERLRIIGRAALKQNAAAAVAGPGGTAAAPVSRAPVVDRKAREDAALSLMRLQQLERELAQLKRALSGSPLNGSAARAGLLNADSNVSGGGDAAMAQLVVSMEPSAPLRDTYGSKVADLEKEVEQRMAEVNQAIAQLRGTGNGMGMGMAALAQPGPAARATASTGSADPLTDPHTLAWAATLAPNTTPSSLDAASPATAQSHAIVPDQLVDRYGATSGTLPLSVLSMPMPAAASLASAPSLASGQPSPINALAGASAPGMGSQLTLRATDPDVYAVGSGVNAVAAERAATPAVDPSQRAAARLSVLALGHQSKTADMDFFDALALAGGNSPGQRRTTISRLRAPDAPTFGSNLVQRAVVDLPEEAGAAATSSSEAAEAARGRAAAPGSSVVAAPPQPGSSFATVGDGAPRNGPSKAGLSSSESRSFTVSPPPGGPKANTAHARVSRVQPEASYFASTTPPRPVRRETIGHAEPCVVMNCAWCDAEKTTEPTAS